MNTKKGRETMPEATISRDRLAELLNEDLKRIPGHHRLRRVFAGAEGRGVHGYR